MFNSVGPKILCKCPLTQTGTFLFSPKMWLVANFMHVTPPALDGRDFGFTTLLD